MNAKERMLKYLDSKSVSQYTFSKETGLSNGFLKSGSSISSENLEIISKVYIDLNLVWLITGDGDMLKITTAQNYSTTDTTHCVAEPQKDYTTSHSKDVKEHFKQLEIIRKEINKDTTLLRLLEDNSKLVDANVKLANANLLLAETNALLSRELINDRKNSGKDSSHTADAV